MNMSATARTRSNAAIQIPRGTPTASAIKKPPKTPPNTAPKTHATPAGKRCRQSGRQPAIGEHIEKGDDDLCWPGQIELIDVGENRDQLPQDQYKADRPPAQHARIIEDRCPLSAGRNDLSARGGPYRGFGGVLIGHQATARSPTIARITSSRRSP